MAKIIPSLLHHKTSQLAYATFDGKVVYFGKWPRGSRRPSAEAIRNYEAHVAAWIMRRHQGLPSRPPTIAKIVKAYLAEFPGTQDEFRETCDRLVQELGDELADGITAYKLNTLRRGMIRDGWTRQRINKQVQKIGELFRWAVEEQMVVVGAYLSVKILSSLKYGRTSAPEEGTEGDEDLG